MRKQSDRQGGSEMKAKKIMHQMPVVEVVQEKGVATYDALVPTIENLCR